MTKKISQLPAATSVDTNDEFVINQDGTTKKLTTANQWDFANVNIDGGNIDGTAIGASSASSGAFTTLTGSGNVNFDSGTLFVDATNNKVGIKTTGPLSNFHIAETLTTGANYELQRWTTASGGVLGLVANDLALADPTWVFRSGTNEPIAFASGAVANEAMRIGSSGNVGIGTTTGTRRFNVSGSTGLVAGNGNQLILDNAGERYTQITFSNNNVSKSYFAWDNTAARLEIGSNLNVTGSLAKGSGSFKIDHPLKPETHHLVHSFVEGPQADLIYRGKVSLVNGQATVNIDEAGRMSEGTFEALNCNVQCFTNNESGWACVRGSVSGNILTIEAQDETCTDEISWMVIGERCDQHMIDTDWTDENGRVITEPEKEQQDAD